MRRVLGLIGCLLILFGIGARAFPVATPMGIQCPTARVQTVRVAVKSACGCVIGHVERAPKEGEAGFKQCRCAEQRHGTDGAAASARSDALPPMTLAFVVPTPSPLPWTTPRYDVSTSDRSMPPALRPPTLS